MTARQLLAWWVERVIKNTTAAGWANTTPTTAYNRQGAIDRAGVPRDNPEFDVVRTCPDWPAITTGGCRELHLPGVLFHAIYDSLRRVEAGCAVRVWPGLDRLQLCHNLTLRVDPQMLPSFRKLENSFFNWTGVPSVFLSDDLSAMKEITKPCLSINRARCRVSFSSQIIPPADDLPL